MACFECEQCGARRYETPLCHGPMKCIEEEKLRELLGANEDEEAMACLIHSHSLLRHYATLLNMHDGGERDIPIVLTDWIARCSEVNAKGEP